MYSPSSVFGHTNMKGKNPAAAWFEVSNRFEVSHYTAQLVLGSIMRVFLGCKIRFFWDKKNIDKDKL